MFNFSCQTGCTFERGPIRQIILFWGHIFHLGSWILLWCAHHQPFTFKKVLGLISRWSLVVGWCDADRSSAHTDCDATNWNSIRCICSLGWKNVLRCVLEFVQQITCTPNGTPSPPSSPSCHWEEAIRRCKTWCTAPSVKQWSYCKMLLSERWVSSFASWSYS